jgi:hypothetical protein
MNERSAGKDPASSPDGLAVFQTYTNLINSERETLWARHNALVLANSLILGALAISPARNAALKGRRAQSETTGRRSTMPTRLTERQYLPVRGMPAANTQASLWPRATNPRFAAAKT